MPTIDICSEFGWKVFGPFLADFMHWLRTEIANIKPQKVFFFSRDGYLMKRCYDIMEARSPIGITSDYVYFSRKSLRTPLLCTASTYERIFDYLSWQRFISYGEVLSYWNIDMREANITEEKARTSIRFEKLGNDTYLKRVFEANKDLIFKRSREQYEALNTYLNEIGLKGRVVIVDIGWHGTMQYALETFINKCGINAEISGLYVGIGASKQLKGTAKGYLYNGETDPKRSYVLCFLGVIEKLFQSFEGSTSGYKCTPNGVVSVKEKFEFAQDDPIIENIKLIQEEAIKYVEFDGIRNSKPFLAFGRNPPRKWLNIFSAFYNLDGGVKLYFLPRKRLYEYGFKEFILALNQSPWKTGFLKKVFFMPLPYFYLYKMLKK